MHWTINYTRTSEKQLRRLDKQTALRIMDFLRERVVAHGTPRAVGKALSGPLGNYWCYRVGDYRAICDIQDSVLCVLVVQIGNRREIYR